MSSRDQGMPESTGAGRAADLEQLVAVSCTWRHAETAAREEMAPRLAGFASHLAERVVLRTCHRIEVFGAERADSTPNAVDGDFVLHRGSAAAERALLVAGGLDSVVIGEEEILGQLRRSYQAALELGQTGPVTNELMRRAIHYGKRVRSRLSPGADRSLVERAMRWLQPRLSARPEGGRAALVFGTGQVGSASADALARLGMRVTVASRSIERASSVVAQLPASGGLRPVLADAALEIAVRADVVVLAVRNASVQLDDAHLSRHSPPLVIDFSTPPAVTAAGRRLLGERLLDLDRLGSVDGARRLSPAAERRLRAEAADEAARFAEWVRQRANGSAVALLRGHAAEVRRRHLDRLRRSERLDPRQLTAVDAMTRALVGELLHGPTIQLRDDPQAAANVRRLFGID